jgi:hypothetical protein
MNMANSDYQESDFNYQANFNRTGDKEKTPRQRRFQYSRANRPAVSHNGIHRRRNKRFSW